jgi:DNA polymerase-3 subunit epsilon
MFLRISLLGTSASDGKGSRLVSLPPPETVRTIPRGFAMREIVLDTETTGLDPSGGDRVVEIGCVELVNHIPSGRKFHCYVNPERPMSIDAARIVGFDESFLRDKPKFSEVARGLVEFLGDDVLIAHNAEFDIAFLNAEFGRIGHAPLGGNRVVDTLMLARRKHPLGPNSLDALMSRYSIDASKRVVHGALLDAELLSEVYIELIGGRQASLMLGDEDAVPTIALPPRPTIIAIRQFPRVFEIPAAALAAHRAAVDGLGPNAIWQRYLQAPAAFAVNG